MPAIPRSRFSRTIGGRGRWMRCCGPASSGIEPWCEPAASLLLMRELQRHQPRHQRRGIKLAEDRLEIAEAARDRMHGRDVAIAGGRQRREAEIDQLRCELRTVLDLQADKGLGIEGAEKGVKRREDDG